MKKKQRKKSIVCGNKGSFGFIRCMHSHADNVVGNKAGNLEVIDIHNIQTNIEFP